MRTRMQIIWTRVTPRFLYDFDIDYDAKNSTTWKVKGKHELGSHKVHWAVSTSSDMSQPIKEGHFETDHERDFTVKVRLAWSLQCVRTRLRAARVRGAGRLCACCRTAIDATS